MTTAKAAPPTQVHQAPAAASSEILPALPRHLEFLFEERPLLPGEHPHQYDTLLQTLIGQVKPTDVIEAIWIKDIVDLIWEAKRFRRWRGQILAQVRFEAATTLVIPVLEAQNHNAFKPDFERAREVEALALGWLNGSADHTSATTELLAERGLTPANVIAHAFQLKLPDIERIERMIASADHRRDALLREIERKRALLGQQLRAASAEGSTSNRRPGSPAKPHNPTFDMTSDRAIESNRRNARASTGPRTAAGKTRSAQNARKHGLDKEDFGPYAEAAAERLVALLVRDLGGERTILDAARAVAAAQTYLRRVRAVKGAMILEGADLPEIRANADGVPDLAVSAELLQGLERLESYERRAFSMRKSAIRRFVVLAGQAGHSLPETAGT